MSKLVVLSDFCSAIVVMSKYIKINRKCKRLESRSYVFVTRQKNAPKKVPLCEYSYDTLERIFFVKKCYLSCKILKFKIRMSNFVFGCPKECLDVQTNGASKKMNVQTFCLEVPKTVGLLQELLDTFFNTLQ